jgi:excisionase family DNA binding protein
MTAARYVSTAQVARALGVGVSTVKRWVDGGVLPAHKTSGGHRKLLVADVIDLARRGDLPHADLSQLTGRCPGERAPDLSRLGEDLHRALLAGDAQGVRVLIHGSYRRGVSIEALADRAIAAAMHRVGHDWEVGRIDVMEEHRASELCAAVLYELKAVLEERAEKSRPLALGGAAEHDHSALPTLLAQMVLLDAGWEAVNLGPNTPFTSLGKAVKDLKPRVLWLSVSHLDGEAEFLRGYRDLYQHAEKAGAAVAIGGRALTEAVRSKMPYTTYGDGLAQLGAFARTLHPRPQRPPRGRPPKED